MRFLLLLSFLSYFINASAQNIEADSLKKRLSIETNDSDCVSLLEGLSYAWLGSNPDTALLYATRGLELAQQMKFRKGEAVCLNALGNVYFHFGNNAKALEYYFKYLAIKEELKEFNTISVAYYNIASVYTEEKDFANALTYVFKAKAQDEKLKDSSAILYDLYSLGSIYGRTNKLDSALYYAEQSYQLSMRFDDKNMIGSALNILAETYLALNNIDLANKYYQLSVPYVKAISDNEVLTSDYFGLAKIYEIKKKFDSSAYYGRNAIGIAREGNFNKQILEVSDFMVALYSGQKKYDSAFFYQQLSIATKDSVFNVEEVKKIENIKFREEQRQQLAEAADQKFHAQIKFYSVIAVSAVFLILAIIFWRNNKQKQQANVLLAEQKQKIEATLSELKSAQAQLIHSEKMASLGQLTAGIAHEIQNPLNFVNNFSEVSIELLDELKQLKSNTGSRQKSDEQDEIVNEIAQSLERINHHGKRADAIVKGMLQHTGTSSGQKEETNINALADEYLHLSYHGMRGKDHSFNVALKTDFDKSIGNINIVPQDIGRLLLNVYNNAFYAVKEMSALNVASGKKYEPLVIVTTKKINLPADTDAIEISVRDNGNGMPQHIVDKIFQPFFTTKPTGQGTGLGLSLSYDIAKAHCGEIKVVSQPGVFTEAIIVLPY